MWFGLFTFTLFLKAAAGHGVLIEPCSQSGKLVYCGDASGVPDYDAHALNCGGVMKTYPAYPDRSPRQCGVCGDAATEGMQDHMPGGRYFDDRVVSNYTSGQNVTLKVHLTSNHMGVMWFDLCSFDSEEFGESCFRQNLTTPSGAELYNISQSEGEDNVLLNMTYSLPAGFLCERCSLRWHWLGGNNPTLPNEYFVNCAFVSISPPRPPPQTQRCSRVRFVRKI